MKDIEEMRKEINETDRKTASLFCRRMKTVRDIALFKEKQGLDIFDPSREKFLIEKNAGYINDPVLKPYYIEFMRNTMEVSKRYQHDITDELQDNQIHMNLKENGYDIVIMRGALKKVSEYIDMKRKVLIVTDDGVPAGYPETAAAQAENAFIESVKQGEQSKNFESLRKILQKLVEENFTRSDCIIAVGGGVAGDLAGFAASCYMRGIDFYNIPTTLLSQVDSSIGGKTAIDFEGIKNAVGAFYQPKKVIIDPDVLKTLPARQISNGLAEAVKMSLTCDKELFEIIEQCDISKNIDRIIRMSLRIKKKIVEQDEKEKGLRKVLNFGHTIGHGIESEQNGKLLHGECVALGMIPMCSENVRERLIKVLMKNGLPSGADFCRDKVLEAVMHDKKFRGGKIDIIKVNEIGSYVTEEADKDDIYELINTMGNK